MLGNLSTKDIQIALVGAPNSGKTTLFNWLTNSNFKTVNYPGSTVDISVGKINRRYSSSDFLIVDTPGVYGINPKSSDEQVTLDYLFNTTPPNLVIFVVDSTQLGRQLPLARQLKSCGFEIMVVITMLDLLKTKFSENELVSISNHLGKIPCVEFDGRLGGGLADLVNTATNLLVSNKKSPQLINFSETHLEEAIKYSQIFTNELFAKKKLNLTTANSLSTKIDHLLLHPFWGIISFITIMTTLFASIFWLAAPIMDFIDFGFTELSSLVLEISPNNLLTQFLSDGLILSVGAVAVFIPQIFILFVGIILLEDSGYLARSAVLIDKPFSKVGLGGRSFVPLLSANACAVPAMMAARTINSKREKFIALFIIPLMTCSARLPVYALLLSVLFLNQPVWKPGLALALLYLGSFFIGALAAKILSLILPKEKNSFFMMELPIYRKPKLLHVLKQALSRTQNYITRAGPAIFGFALLIWLSTTFPNYNLEDKTERLTQSYAGQVGKIIEPVFTPMGGDWRTGVSLISAFAAREVFVSSLAVVFNVTDDDETTQQQKLLMTLKDSKNSSGDYLFTTSSIVGLIIFFMIALQCLSTVSIASKEFNDKKIALIQLVSFTLIAYVAAVVTVQGLRLLGFS